MNSISALAHFKQFSEQLQQVYDKDEARAITDLIYREVLTLKATQLLVIDRILSADEITFFDTILKRLLTGEPVQYVLGHTWFCGLKMEVNSSVLIPRPETEELTEQIIQYFHHNQIQQGIGIDFGTGSGCIPVAIKKNVPGIQMYGIDVSTDALKVATGNAFINKVNVDFMELDMLNEAQTIAWLDTHQREEMPCYWISNPPYIAEQEQDQMHKNVLQFEPHLALFSKQDPLLFYRTLSNYLFKIKVLPKVVWLEINPLYADETLALFAVHTNYSVQFMKDMQGKSRFLSAILNK